MSHAPREKPRGRPGRTSWWRLASIALALPFAALGWHYVLTWGDGYCWMWPSIATTFTEDYSERDFGRVTVGMTEAQVAALIGLPLFRHPFPQRGRHPGYRERGDEAWAYSMETPDRSWAWLSREIIFRDGRVVQKVYWTYHH